MPSFSSTRSLIFSTYIISNGIDESVNHTLSRDSTSISTSFPVSVLTLMSMLCGVAVQLVGLLNTPSLFA